MYYYYKIENKINHNKYMKFMNDGIFYEKK